MTTPEPVAAGDERSKSDDDDHDLLTFGEAGERLSIEVRAAERRVAELETEHAAGDVVAAARARLSDLRAAAHRNSASPINDANFEKFFGYPGKAKRNLPTPPAIP